MIDYTLLPEEMVMESGSSDGTQIKYYKDGYWYKQDRKGYEGLSEFLVTGILKCSNIKKYAVYERCKINGKSGCRSRDFLEPGEELVSFERLHKRYTGRSITDVVRTYPEVKDRINYTIDFIGTHMGVDVTEYLAHVLALDMLILNQDRHFNNLCIIVQDEGNSAKLAPIFDNGDSLMSDWAKFDRENTLEENLDRSVAMPFSGSAYQQVTALPIRLALNYERLNEFMQEQPSSRALEVLEYQIARYRSFIPTLADG